MEGKTSNGIVYSYACAINGVRLCLFPEDGVHSKNDVIAARGEVRNAHDIVGGVDIEWIPKHKNKNYLKGVLKQAFEAHHEYEKGLSKPDPDWAEWYANYIVQNNLL